ncbi:hypothetical protein OG739_13885 [Streptomyces longwoodensis]|uniref:hypothetical protein n=1 Tax=Streptomyces longwoodensis TaxID=68231 RepID=UPI002E81F53B|nr:hypothetical protein [Streptomyces longwoodensis]WUC59770.1 hypothetical protein OHA09_23130 [Streptomyces longwoodensis]WUC73298.1 hypothetical protein OG416_22125 [Streptomyces longwoodensis]
MRRLPLRSTAATALCAAIVIGIAGPAAAATDTARDRAHAAFHAPVPDANRLLAQVKDFGDLGAVLTPVTDLLTDALRSDSGQLTSEQATRFGDAIREVIARITATSAVLPSTPSAPSAPGDLPASVLPAPLDGSDHDRTGHGKSVHGEKATDLTDVALTGLQNKVDALVQAVTSGDTAQVGPAASGLITGLVDLVTAVLVGSGLPAADLAGLPSLSTSPETTPTLPAPPEIPAPDVSAPLVVPALPDTPAAAEAASRPATPAMPAR